MNVSRNFKFKKTLNGKLKLKEANSKLIFDGEFINGTPVNKFKISKFSKEFILTQIQNYCIDD